MDLTTKTPEELTQLSEEIKAELLRRQNSAVVDREIGEVLERARENGVTETPEQGEQWVQPTTAADAYLAGDIVEHDGATWESTLNGNVWEPGVSGWRRKRTQPGGLSRVKNLTRPSNPLSRLSLTSRTRP